MSTSLSIFTERLTDSLNVVSAKEYLEYVILAILDLYND